MDVRIACTGGSRRGGLLALCLGAVLALLAACGGGGEGAVAVGASESAADAPQPGELPAELLFAGPRAVDHTPSIALAWSSEGAYTGRVVAQIELGLSFAASTAFELQHNGAPAFYEAEDANGLARFELRYADGFFLLTAQRDNDVTIGLPFGVDLYPPDVPRVPPLAPPCPSVEEVCSNSLGFISFMDWPKRAGESATRLVPRADPAMLRYSVFIKVDERAEWFETIGGASGQSIVMPRGEAWRLDFPTARIKIRGCNEAGQCVESAERPLQSALVGGVLPLAPRGAAANGHVAMDFSGHRLVAPQQLSSAASQLVIYGRPTRDDRWFTLAQVSDPLPGFGRTFALSGDGLTLAVEASPCAVTTVVCNDSQVVVYRADVQGTTWREQARMPSARAPKLNNDGSRMAAIAISAQTGVDAVLSFARNGDAWRALLFPAIDYTPLDIAISDEGFTVAVSRQGTRLNPCGCRAVVVYDWIDEPTGWRAVATVRSAKRLDSVGSPNDDGFGFAAGSGQSLALDGNGERLAVGASLDSSDASDTVGDPGNTNAPQSGAIHVFQRQADGSFAKQAFVKPREAKPLDHFGHTVALNVIGTVLHGGARGLAANAAGIHHNHAAGQPLPTPTPGAGGSLTGAAAYVFERDADVWAQRAAMAAPDADTADFSTYHGLAVSHDGSVTALGTGVRDATGAVARRVFVY